MFSASLDQGVLPSFAQEPPETVLAGDGWLFTLSLTIDTFTPPSPNVQPIPSGVSLVEEASTIGRLLRNFADVQSVRTSLMLLR